MELTDVMAERAIESGLYNYGSEVYTDVSDIITDTAFTTDATLAIWKVLEKIFKDSGAAKPDIPTFLSVAKTLGYEDFFDNKEELKHLRAVISMKVERGNVRNLAMKIVKLRIARELQDELAASKDELGEITGDEAVETILAMAEARVFDYVSKLSGNESGGSVVGEGLDEYIQNLIDHPISQVGLKTGWDRYDQAIGGGLRRKTVGVIGARMKVGKSQAGMNIARYVSTVSRLPVWYGDTELDKKDHQDRNLAALSMVPVNDIERGVFGGDPAQVDAVKLAASVLKEAPYRYECIAGMPFEEVLGKMRRWVLQEVGLREDGQANDCLMVFDYLKLMDSSAIGKQLQEYQVLGFMMTSLHNFAVRYGVPILVLVQLNRDGIDSEGTDSVSGSDRIGWLCSHLSILKVQSPEEKAEQVGSDVKYSHKLVTLVARHGAGLPDNEYINMRARYAYGLLEEGPTKSELSRGGSLSNRQAAGFETEVPDEENSVEFGSTA